MSPIHSSGIELQTALCLDLNVGSYSSSLYSAHISFSEEKRDRTGSYSTEWMVLVITVSPILLVLFSNLSHNTWLTDPGQTNNVPNKPKRLREKKPQSSQNFRTAEFLLSSTSQQWLLIKNVPHRVTCQVSL